MRLTKDGYQYKVFDEDIEIEKTLISGNVYIYLTKQDLKDMLKDLDEKGKSRR